MYIYKQTEFAGKDNCIHDLWTVGFYDPNGEWFPESDHLTPEEAANRTAYLNGIREEENVINSEPHFHGD